QPPLGLSPLSHPNMSNACFNGRWYLYVVRVILSFLFFFFIAPATPEIYTLSLHDALPIYHDVVRVRFAQTGRRDLDEFGLGAERLDIAHAAIAHAAAQPTHHLEEHVGSRAAVGHACLDALGHELGRRDLTLLEVAVGRTFLHRAEAAHAADHLEAPALE